VECLCPVGLRRTREDPVTVPADAPPRRRIVDLDLPSEDVAPGPVQMDLLDLLARP